VSSEASGPLERDALANRRPPVLVAGIGNLLLGDEGLGVHAVRALEQRRAIASSGATLVDAGTALFDVLAECRHEGTLVLLDAVRAGQPPGTVYRLELDPGTVLAGAPRRDGLSLHSWDALDALSAASMLGRVPGRVVLLGIEPACVEPGTSLSPPVLQAMPRLLDAAEREVAEARSQPSRALP